MTKSTRRGYRREIYLVRFEFINDWTSGPEPIAAFDKLEDARAYADAANVYFNRGGTDRVVYTVDVDGVLLNPGLPGEE